MTNKQVPAAYHEKSHSKEVLDTVAGSPPCPACADGALRLWEIVMSFAFTNDGTTPPPRPARYHYAQVMVCRRRDTGSPGCGFHLPVVSPRTSHWPAEQ